MNKKQLFLIAAGTLLAGTLFAQEVKSTLPEKANSITLSIENVPKIDLKISGFAQVQYVTSHSSGGIEPSKSGFAIRRANIGVSAKIDENWSARIAYEFDSKSTGGSVGNGFIDKALIEYKNDAGTLQLGCRKVNFMIEEYGSCLTALCMENSLGTSYVLASTLAGRHLGAFWEGKVEDVAYGVALTNAVANDYDSRSNNYAISANAGYTLNLKEDAKLLLALNTTFNYGNDGDRMGQNQNLPFPQTNTSFTYGFEPYAKFTSGNFTAILDCFFIDGKRGLTRTYGANATAAYKIDEKLEPVARISYVNSHNRNLNASMVKNVSDSGTHAFAMSYYFGANYYLNKHIKISAGYEYIHLFGRGVGGTLGSDDSGGLRLQLQAAF